MLQIQYRGAELKLPAGVDMDVVAAPLRPFSRFDRFDQGPQLLYCLKLHRSQAGDGLVAVVTQQ